MSNKQEELEISTLEVDNQEVDIKLEGEEPPRTGGGTGGPK